MLCHNGEINALAGNNNRMRARAVLGTEAAGLGPEELFHPVLDEEDSDSGQLDSAVELLTRGGRDVRHAIAMTIPEAWEGEKDIDPAVRAFYRYHASIMEPWDGPAGVVFTDGVGVGASLDRNGLRPLRYSVCEDGFVACCSETGAIDVSGHGTVRRGRLGPGQMLFVDPTRGFLDDEACKERLGAGGTYGRWAADGLRPFSRGRAIEQTPEPEEIERRQAMFGYSKEELAMVLRAMANDAKEPTFSMGDDSPLPHLAGRPRPLHHYLKQRFAQVTNPPIDHLRERLVMSLRTLLGPAAPDPHRRPRGGRAAGAQVVLPLPVGGGRAADVRPGLRRRPPRRHLPAVRRPRLAAGRRGRLCDRAEELAAGRYRHPHRRRRWRGRRQGARARPPGHRRRPFPPGQSRPPIGHVAGDLHRRRPRHPLHRHPPGLWRRRHLPRPGPGDGGPRGRPQRGGRASGPDAQARLQAAMEDGVLKIMSKMGISTVDSYRGAQIFEIIGLGPEVVDVCFPGMPSIVGGIGWDQLESDAVERHGQGRLGEGGYYRVRKKGEFHTHTDEVVKALNEMKAAHLLQSAIKGGGPEAAGSPNGNGNGNGTEQYKRFADLVNGRPPTELHDIFDLVPAGPPVDLEDVEPALAITRRFSTGAMSHGALSREAHETLTEAMNLIGGLSNCGEGGESFERFKTRGQPTGDKNSRIKQIASGRFGVTPEYCAFADELNIKIAQGSKPGEGGQIPGNKVSEEIAALRHTQPGIGLISPPPHHDIYSIEDLAQLIYDLKQVNRNADVSVKLVAEDGVGTIAAGVVKALAEVVHISGCNGGTGASPLTSIKHAGLPWELGVAETQRALIDNGLRDRVRLRMDGGLMTGRDVLMAALLGADEYSFGTAAMIAEGCIMLRACHKDTCSTGIATQRPHLRAKFAGTPEGVAAYMLFLAEEIRELLAGLGFRTLDQAIGRVECLRQRVTGDPRADAMDFTPLIAPPADPDAPRHFVKPVPIQRPRSALGDRLVDEAFQGVWDGAVVALRYKIGNSDRTIGAALGGALALEFGSAPPPGTAAVRFDGSAGQSFGAFLGPGIEFELVGEANDYVGKAMAGGRIVIRPPEDDAGTPVLAGNTCLYGATGGELFIAGSAGERFAVRNSGASAVVEGVGDHACEYMTGGLIVILGPVGYNLGAGDDGRPGVRLGPGRPPVQPPEHRPGGSGPARRRDGRGAALEDRAPRRVVRLSAAIGLTVACHRRTGTPSSTPHGGSVGPPVDPIVGSHRWRRTAPVRERHQFGGASPPPTGDPYGAGTAVRHRFGDRASPLPPVPQNGAGTR